MNKKNTKLFESIKTIGFQDVIMEQSVSANDFINELRGPDGLVSELAKQGRVKDSEWLKGQVSEFNEKYSTLNEDELSLFKKLVNSTDSEKEDLFEEYKENGIKLLKKLNEESNSAKVTQSINKIVEMKYDSKDADNNIISLFELKQGLQ